MNNSLRSKKLIENATKSGLLQSLIDLEAGNLGGRDPKLIEMVATAVNQKKVILFDDKSDLYLQTLEGVTFFELMGFICEMMPKLKISHLELMPLVNKLVAKGGDDGAANMPNAAFRNWCSQNSSRANAVIQDALSGNEDAECLLCFALEATDNSETALTILADNKKPELLLRATTALGRMKKSKKVAQEASIVLSFIACENGDEKIRNNALYHLFYILTKYKNIDRQHAKRALDKAVHKPTARTLDVISSILMRCGDQLSDGEVVTVLNALSSVDAKHLGTISRIDMAAARMVGTGRTKLISEFIKNYIIDNESRNGLELFQGYRSEVIQNPEKLAQLVVNWFVDGDLNLCSCLSDAILHHTDLEIKFALKASMLPKDANDQKILCRRAAGFLIHKPVAAASVIVSVLKRGDPSIADDLKYILYDPLLLCFGGKLVDYLKKESSGKKARGKDKIKEALKWRQELVDNWNGIENLIELHPSESHRQFEWIRWNRIMESVVKEGMKKSVFLPLITTHNVLYGTNPSPYVKDPSGKFKKVDMPLKEQSFTAELPLLLFCDPEGFQIRLLELRLSKEES